MALCRKSDRRSACCLLLALAACGAEEPDSTFRVRFGADGVVHTPAGAAFDQEGHFATEPRFLEGFSKYASSYWIVAADARRWRESRRDEEQEFRVRLEVTAAHTLSELAKLLEVVSVFGVEGPVDGDVVVAGSEIAFTMRALHLEAQAHGTVDGFEKILSVEFEHLEGRPIRVLMSEASYRMSGSSQRPHNLAERLESLRSSGEPVLVSLRSFDALTTVGEIWHEFGPWLGTSNWRLHTIP